MDRDTGDRARESERKKEERGENAARSVMVARRGWRRARPHAGISITRGTQSGMYVVTSGLVSCGGSSRFTLYRRCGDGKSRLPGSG